MKSTYLEARMRVVVAFVVIALVMVFSPAWLGAGETPVANPEEVIAELKTKLGLSDQQVKDLSAAIAEFGQKLDELHSKQEAAGEEDDPGELIEGAKRAQAEYQEKLAKILSPSQLEGYNAYKEAVIKDTFRDLAEIKLLDFQPHVGFSDDQLKQLTPVLADSMEGIIKIAWENAGKRLRIRQKIKVAKELKRIQSHAEQQVQQNLSPDQLKKWQAYKEQVQAKQQKS